MMSYHMLLHCCDLQAPGPLTYGSTNLIIQPVMGRTNTKATG